ncbi:MAG: thermonuclease family protein [Deltaproteobacteria bacterium]|nr:thermonuclease family protein [Deltaproteobacteria bacterium]
MVRKTILLAMTMVLMTGYWVALSSDVSEELKTNVVRVEDAGTLIIPSLKGGGPAPEKLNVRGVIAFPANKSKVLTLLAKSLAVAKNNLMIAGETAKGEAEGLAGRQIIVNFAAPQRNSANELQGYIFIDGRDYGLSLIERGLAVADPNDTDHPNADRYTRAQERAAANKAGVWGM